MSASPAPALLTFRGETRSLTHWARRIGITRQGLVLRLRTMRPYVALSTPVNRRRERTRRCSFCRRAGHNVQRCAAAFTAREDRVLGMAERRAP